VDRAGDRSEAPHRGVEVLDNEGKAPQASGPIPVGVLGGSTLGLLNDLQNLIAKPEEPLARRSRRGWLLADPAEFQTSGLEGADRAIERR
jgi:hypothetical protein